MSRPLKSIRCEHVRIWVLFHWCFTSVSLSGQKSAQSTANYALCTPSARETHSRLAALPIPSAHGPREISGESRTWRLLTCAFVPFPEHVFLQCRSLKKKRHNGSFFLFLPQAGKTLKCLYLFFPSCTGQSHPHMPTSEKGTMQFCGHLLLSPAAQSYLRLNSVPECKLQGLCQGCWKGCDPDLCTEVNLQHEWARGLQHVCGRRRGTSFPSYSYWAWLWSNAVKQRPGTGQGSSGWIL